MLRNRTIRTGMRKASVFPEPVIAAPRTSRPCKATPIASR